MCAGWIPFQQIWHIPAEWEEMFANVAETEEYIRDEYESNTIYPDASLIYNAFIATPLEQVKVVIIGQDPYPTKYIGPDSSGNQICIQKATGLAFSVPPEIPINKIPLSLRFIFEEVVQNGFNHPCNGSLEGWARQGVLLLNASLTVRQRIPAFHLHTWQKFTDNVIKLVSAYGGHKVFMLWGIKAKMKLGLIDETKHLILTAAHPSPRSVRNFKGCGHFMKCNQDLAKYGHRIDWSL